MLDGKFLSQVLKCSTVTESQICFVKTFHNAGVEVESLFLHEHVIYIT